MTKYRFFIIIKNRNVPVKVLIVALFGVAYGAAPAPYNPAPYVDNYPAIPPNYNVSMRSPLSFNVLLN